MNMKHASVACRSATKGDACQSKKARTIITILPALFTMAGQGKSSCIRLDQ
jgi:hypothetical protein